MADQRGGSSGGSEAGGLRGRSAECAVLDGVIAAVRGGESRTLVVRGDAGIGKTALPEYAVAAATDLRVLRAAGVESEMELPFAVLHQLCVPMLDGLGRLPDPQREALSIVFGRSAGPRPDPFMVGLAVLTLISEVAAQRPLLCVVDDVQWLDKATAQTLTLVARRLRAEAVGLVFGARETGDEFGGLPYLEVPGPRNADARALLGSVVGFMLDARVRDRIVTETRGNPLALLELPRGLTATQLAGGFGLSGPHALPGRIEKSYARQADLLPPETRSLLLIAAAEPVGDPLLVWRAAERLGGFAAAAAFLHRCVALTREPARRTDRALAAAHASLRTGAFETALALLTAAEAGPLDDLGRARVDLLRAEAAYSLNRGSDAPPLLLRAARALETLDPRLARETYLDAWSAALFAGGLATSGTLLDVSRAARAIGAPTEPVRASELLLDGLTLLFTEGREAGVPVLEQAAPAFASADISTEEVLRWGWLAVVAAAIVWDFETCMAVSARQVQVARASGALAVLAVGINVLGQAAAMAGDLGEAASLIVEFQAVKEATGTHVAPYGTLVHAALKGREDEAFPLFEATISSATADGQGTAVQYARWASSVVLNALGRYEEALTAAEQASEDTPEFWVAAWALSERVEAAVRSGQTGHAALALERFEAQTRGADSGWARGLRARSQALLSQGETAESFYLEAIDRLRHSRIRPELARAYLLYGEWLRREGRRVDARTQLRTAHDMFATIGMVAFAERTRRELLATGEIVRKRNVETHDELTRQEKQIALLARDGLSNPEVGSRLFISPRTVEWHLRKVFAKLEISSRKELRTVLSELMP
jgi:DNA-binding CsgD family transcriptional regulator